MNKVIITADSTCDLSAQMIQRFDFKIIPLYVNLGDDSFKDGLEIQPDRIYEFVEKEKQLPKTAAASIPDYVEFFSQYTKEGCDVVHFNISSTMSVTHQNARMAAEEAEGEGKVYVVDSANLSTGTGLLMLDAYDLKEEGRSAAEIYDEVLKRVPLVRASFVVDQLDYLKMGGRCSSVAALGATVLKLHPRIFVADGKMGAGEKYRGSIDGVMVQYAKAMLSQNPATVEKVKAVVKESGLFDEVFETMAGCVVTSHCGPGTLGVLFEVTE